LAQPGEQRPRGVERHDPAGVNDGDPVAQPLRLVEVVGRQQDRDLARGAERRDQVQQLVTDARVEPDGRLVEEQHLGLRHQRPGDLQPSPLPAAVAGNRPVGEAAEAEGVEHVGNPGPNLVAAQPPQAGMDLEVAPAGERAVDDGLLEHHGARSPGSPRLAAHVVPGDTGSATGRHHSRRQHPDRRRLARAVGTEEAEDLAGRDREVDPLHRIDTTGIGLAQPDDFDRRCGLNQRDAHAPRTEHERGM